MPTSAVTGKGQTVIPKPVRAALGLHPSDRVDFAVRDEQNVLLRPAASDVRQLKGLLHRPGRKAVSLEAMRPGVASRGGRLP
jgi:AbrB family looped-hinge helix DNA binding protein